MERCFTNNIYGFVVLFKLQYYSYILDYGSKTHYVYLS